MTLHLKMATLSTWENLQLYIAKAWKQ